jgi:hypothetical protein
MTRPPKARARCPVCEKVMTVHRPTAMGERERKSLGDGHVYPAHPRGGPYCEGWGRQVMDDDYLNADTGSGHLEPTGTITHLIDKHGLKPWSIWGTYEDQHREKHLRECDHTHDA